MLTPSPNGARWPEPQPLANPGRFTIVNVRRGPNCASIGSAQLAFVGVGHSSTLCAAAHVRIAAVVLGGQVIQHDVDRCVVGARGTDALEGGEGVCAAFVLVQHTPQLVAGQVVAAVEVADAVVAVVGRRQPVRVLRAGPAGAVTGPDAQRPELVEGED